MKIIFGLAFLSVFAVVPASAAILRTVPVVSTATIRVAPAPIVTTSTPVKYEIAPAPTVIAPLLPTSSRETETITTATVPKIEVAPDGRNVISPSPAPIDARKIRERQMLNPQPEPPMPEIKNLPVIQPMIKNPGGSALERVLNSLNRNASGTKFLIKPELEVKNNKTILRSKGIEVALRSVPTAVYGKLVAVFEKNNIKMLNQLTLDIENGKPVYSVQIEQPAKLLGFIPIKLKSTIKVGDNGAVSQTGLPWYASVSKEAVKAADKLSKLPNLVLKSVRFEPVQYADGESVDAYLTVENQGLGYAVEIPDFVGNTCSAEKLYYNDAKEDLPSRWYCMMIVMAPGETQEFSFPMGSISCPSKAKFVIADNEQFFEETTKEDNSLTVDLKCK